MNREQKIDALRKKRQEDIIFLNKKDKDGEEISDLHKTKLGGFFNYNNNRKTLIKTIERIGKV